MARNINTQRIHNIAPAVLTVTLNPAIDRTVVVPHFAAGQSHEALHTVSTAGGKGINVSRALQVLGVKTIPTGFAGGTNGQKLLSDLIVEKMEPHFVFIDGDTRTNVTVIDQKSGKMTRILEPGPMISGKDLHSFWHRYTRLVETNDWIVLSGRGIRGTPPELYREMIEIATKAGKNVALDTSAKDLQSGLKAKPFLLKVNRSEAEFICKHKLTNTALLKKALQKFSGRGVSQVIISLGSEGAVGTDGKSFFHVTCPKIRVVNTVGTGDSMLAGFVHAALQNKNFQDALAFSVAVGTASALHPTPGAFSRSDLNKVLPKISLKTI